jgi:hypothetical protein
MDRDIDTPLGTRPSATGSPNAVVIGTTPAHTRVA